MRLYGRIVYASALFVGCCLFLNGVSAQNTPSPSLEGVEIEMNLTHVPKGTEVIFGKNLEKRVVDSAVVSDHTFRVHVGKLTSIYSREQQALFAVLAVHHDRRMLHISRSVSIMLLRNPRSSRMVVSPIESKDGSQRVAVEIEVRGENLTFASTTPAAPEIWRIENGKLIQENAGRWDQMSF